MNDEDIENIVEDDVYDMTKVESRSTIDYKKAESTV